jgi:glutamate--cysteine ligase
MSRHLTKEALWQSVETLFLGMSHDATSKRIGAELELIPFDEATHSPIHIVGGSLEIIRRVADRAGWTEVAAGDDPPTWSVPDGGCLSFEPGGQLELSSAPSENPSRLIRDLRCTAQLLSGAFASSGIVLEALGVDTYNDISEVELQLHRPRYERMARYFDSIGESGAKMMRQTASLQLNVDPGEKPFERWTLLNSLAPYVTAIFANSPMYRGRPAHHQSLRSEFWRTLDTSRTGIAVNGGNHVDSYLQFALEASAMMRMDAPYDSFAAWMSEGDPAIEDWNLHLTTLFPEVRPRKYFELRSADSVDPDQIAAPIVFVIGLVYDEESSRAAAEILSSVEPPALDVAGRDGLREAAIRDVAVQLADLSLEGCKRLGSTYVASGDLDEAPGFLKRYTHRGRSPADDRS